MSNDDEPRRYHTAHVERTNRHGVATFAKGTRFIDPGAQAHGPENVSEVQP